MSGGNWKDAFYAVQNNDLALLSYHISEGVDLDYQHPEAFSTLLLEAIQQGHVEIVELLLKKGANPNKAEEFGGVTPMRLARQLKDPTMIRLLSDYVPKPSLYQRLKGLLSQ